MLDTLNRYEAGVVRKTTEQCQICSENDTLECYEALGDWEYHHRPGEATIFYLPHSCDEWVIGSVEDAKKLIADLTKLIDSLE